MALGHGLGPWPWAMALGHGPGPWPWAMAPGPDLGPWPGAMARGHGQGPKLMAMAVSQGCAQPRTQDNPKTVKIGGPTSAIISSGIRVAEMPGRTRPGQAGSKRVQVLTYTPNNAARSVHKGIATRCEVRKYGDAPPALQPAASWDSTWEVLIPL